MKKITGTLTVIILLLTAGLARAEGLGVPGGVQGMITGALIGSVFGPDKKVRGKNALVGAISGYLIGNQYANRDQTNNNWLSSYNAQPAPTQQQTVVVYQNPTTSSYWQESRFVSSYRVPGSQTIIIDRRTPVVVYQSREIERSRDQYRRNRRHRHDSWH